MLDRQCRLKHKRPRSNSRALRGQAARLLLEPLERRDLLSISIVTTSLPNWTVNQPGYSQTIKSSGASSAVTFSVDGTLPPGLTMVGPSFTTIDDPNALMDPNGDTYAYGISGNTIVGSYDVSLISHGFIYDGTNWTTLDDPSADPGGIGTFADGISGSTVVGFYYDTSGAVHGFSYNGSTSAYANIDDPLASGGTYPYGISGSTVVGNYSDATGTHGFTYNGRSFSTLDYPGALPGQTFVAGISGNTVVGYYEGTDGAFHGFVYSSSAIYALNDPSGALGTFARGISGSMIVGDYIDSSRQDHGFIYDTTTATYTTIDDPIASGSTQAFGIFGSDIVGAYQLGGATHGYVYNSVATLSGTPTATGIYKFSVTETDDAPSSATQPYTVMINPAVSITTTALPAWTAGTSGYSQSLAASGGTGTLTFSSTGTLPPGLTLSSSGVLSGNPSTPGSYPFTATATDTVGAAASQNYTVTVNPAVSITTTSLPGGTAGAAYSQTVSATGGTGTVTFSTTAGTLPTGLTLSTAGVLSGTPSSVGNYSFTVAATDTLGSSSSQNYSVTINPPGTVATQLVVSAPPSATAGTSFNLTVTAEDGGGLTTTSFSGTVTLTSTAGADIAPTSVVLSSGTATIPVTLTAAGSQTLTASFTGLNPGTASVSVSPGPLGQYLVGIPGSSTVPAGSNFLVTVQAADSFGNPITSYSGPATVTASVTPASAASNFPMSVSISSTGLGLFLANLQKVGSYTITTASGSVSGSAGPVTVTPGSAAKLGFATQPVDTPTGLTLPAVSVQVQDLFGNPVTTDNSDTVTIGVASGPGSLASGSTASATVVNGMATFNNLTFIKPGAYTLSAKVPGVYTGPNSAAFSVQPLQVVPGSFVGTPSGFSLQFNTPFLVNSTTPVLYGQGFASKAPTPSVTLTQTKDAAGNPVNIPVVGSLIVSTATNSITYLATNTTLEANNGSPILPDGTYTAVLTSTAAANGFQALNSGGGFLDGKLTGTAGSGNFTATFTVSAKAAGDDVLWVPATADGPGQPLVAPGMNQAGGGYPVYLDDGTGSVTSVRITVNYNPTLLNVTGATTNGSLPGSTFTLNTALSTPGKAVLDYSDSGANSDKLTKGQVALGFITASVPSGTTANPTPYKAKDLLHLAGPSINGNATPVVTSDGLHVVAYVGDADGNGSYSSNDAVQITRVALQTDAGFAAYPLIDPVIVADTDGNGFVPADGALQANEAGVGFTTANLSNPPVPPGVHFTPVANNVDPTLSVGRGAWGVGRDGQLTVTVPVNIDDAHPAGSTGLIAGHLALTYDPSVYTVSAADIHPGSLLIAGSGWSVTPTIDPTTGQIAIALSSITPISSTLAGSLVTIDFHPIGEPGGVSPRSSSAINLVASVTPNGQYVATELEDAQGAFTLSPTPANRFDPRLDSVITLTATSSPASVADAVNDALTTLQPALSLTSSDAPAPAGDSIAVQAETTTPLVSVNTGNQPSAAVASNHAIAVSAVAEAVGAGALVAASIPAVLPAVPGPSIAIALTAWPLLLTPTATAHAGQALSDTLSPARGPITPNDSERILTSAWLRNRSDGDIGGFDGDRTIIDLNWDVVDEWQKARRKPAASSQATPPQTATDRAAMDLYFAQVSEDTSDADDE